MPLSKMPNLPHDWTQVADNANTQYTAAELKEKLMANAQAIKTFVDDTLTVEVDAQLALKETPTGAQAKADTAQSNAKTYADGTFATRAEVQGIVLGQIPNDSLGTAQMKAEQKRGVASGVASLDVNGKVPSEQLPALNFIPTSEKGAANGVATLGADGIIPKEQMPVGSWEKIGNTLIVDASAPAQIDFTDISLADYKQIKIIGWIGLNNINARLGLKLNDITGITIKGICVGIATNGVQAYSLSNSSFAQITYLASAGFFEMDITPIHGTAHIKCSTAQQENFIEEYSGSVSLSNVNDRITKISFFDGSTGGYTFMQNSTFTLLGVK